VAAPTTGDKEVPWAGAPEGAPRGLPQKFPWVRLLPALAEQGIVTLRQALDASQKTYFAQVKY
jgi:hypothetical protein